MPQSHRRKNPYEAEEEIRTKRSRFVDIEAVVSDEDGEEVDDEDDTFVDDSFIETADTAEAENARHHARYARLDNQLEIEEDEINAEDIARELTERYRTRLPSRFIGDRNEIPQRLLLPSVHDPGLWRIRVKVFALVHLLLCTHWYLGRT